MIQTDDEIIEALNEKLAATKAKLEEANEAKNKFADLSMNRLLEINSLKAKLRAVEGLGNEMASIIKQMGDSMFPHKTEHPSMFEAKLRADEFMKKWEARSK